MTNRRYINPSLIQAENNVQASAINNTGVNGLQSISITNNTQSTPVFPWGNPKMLSPDYPPNMIPFPPYFRSVSSVFPSTKDAAAACKIPFGLVVTPGLVSNAPLIDCSNSIVPRCTSCQAYLCPQCKVSGDGRSWICAICHKPNPIQNNPYDSVPFSSKPEMQNPVYDVLAPDPYKHINGHPTLCFIIDTSYPAYASGLTGQMASSIKASIASIPDYYHVALITMSNIITVFDFVEKREFAICDLTECTLSFNQKNCCPEIKDIRESLESAMDSLIQNVPSETIIGHCLGSALIVAENLLANIGGLLLVGFIGLPVYGPYVLKKRVVQNNDEQPLLRLPPDGTGKFYREIAFRLNRAAISAHYYTAGTEFLDLSTSAVSTGLTCGECNYYGQLDETARAKMHSDIFATITNQYCWDSTIRLRCSNGIKLQRTHTNCTLRSGDLVSFPIISRSDSIAFELNLESNIANSAIFQLAMVFSNNSDQRMIRVFTFESPLSADPNIICKSIDEATLTTLVMRRALSSVLSKGPAIGSTDIRTEMNVMFSRSTNYVSMYHLLHSILCNQVIRARPHPLGVDGRMSVIIGLRSISVNDLLLYLYPKMYALDSDVKTPLPLSGQSFSYGSCFLVHTVEKIYIWVSNSVSQEFLSNVFGVQSFEQLPSELPTLENPTNVEVHNLLNECWSFSGHYLPIEIIPQQSPRESIFADILVDDSTACGSNLSQWMNEIKITH